MPISQFEEQILDAVNTSDGTIVSGATGCGKSTQVLKLLVQIANKNKDEWPVICTQPRKIAATSIAETIAKEINCPVGREVCYAIRFDHKFQGGLTKLK